MVVGGTAGNDTLVRDCQVTPLGMVIFAIYMYIIYLFLSQIEKDRRMGFLFFFKPLKTFFHSSAMADKRKNDDILRITGA
jgi:hypothetical protein